MKLHSAAIHQPDFLPWMGVFNKIFRVEQFISFDVVQLTIGKSWSSRVKILLNGKEHWITMPLKKAGNAGQKIYETEMVDPGYNWKKMMNTIRQAYLKAPHFNEVYDFLSEIKMEGYSKLAEFNYDFLQKLTRKLNNNETVFVKCSDNEKLKESKNLRTELIVETCIAYGVKNYLSGEGCLSFLEPEQFTQNAIDLKFQGFKQIPYKQINAPEFVPGLSIIDTLMNCGFDGTKSMLDVVY